jgi:hypothetical protein
MMTLAQCIAKAEAALADQVDEAKAATEFFLQRRGATDEEISAFMELHVAELAEWKAKVLADVRSWLERDGEQLH